ncbi:MAG: undecaprenyl/decaprenyl-phosphate alpha-N-acetylglucosaminyl 1-phosphate transferase [candidate division Zixibacteria bacterium]|nr:undecaprenyl/decaprenyl-phosphate alpha-N-acetylglucosaminyl 1-phosphate transferase [Candidatus Tariuqbacter arcticus]
MKRRYVVLAGIATAVFLLPPLRNYFVVSPDYRPLYLIAFAGCLSFFLTYIVRKLAINLGALDKPDERKVHIHATPRWGGLAIYSAFIIVLLYNFDFSLPLKGIIIGGTLLVAIGLLDDRFCVSAKIRLLFQLMAAGIAIWTGARMTFLPDTWWGNGLEIVLTMIWFIGITNAMNFLDGMDGLCAGLVGISSFFFGAVAVRTHQPFFMFLSAALCGACIGFLPYNFRKRKSALIFLGDTGSTFLGFTLAGIALIGDWAVDNYVAVIVPVIIMAIPIFDMSMTTFMRIKERKIHNIGEWLHFTGKDHFHHRLADMGFGKRKTVQLIHLFAACLGINGFILKDSELLDAGLLLTETLILFVVLGFVLVFVKKQYQYWAKMVSELAGMAKRSDDTYKNTDE